MGWSKLTVKLDVTLPSQPVSWMSSPSKKLTKLSVLSTTSKVDLPFTESPPKRHDTNSARSPRLVLHRREFHSLSHDARTIRYPNPDIKVNDTVIIDIETGDITDHVKFDTGNLCMITGGGNTGRVGVIQSRDRHPGSYDIVHVKDATGASFATRLSNIFVIGRGKQALVSLPRQKGIKITIAEEREKRLGTR